MRISKCVIICVLALLLLLVFSCSPYEPYSSTYAPYNSPVDPWEGYDLYLSQSDYTLLLNSLETKSNITKAVIDEELERLNVRQDYDYSYYDGTSNCHGLNWNAWSSGWIYYRDVDIWVDDSGNLKRSMCSYYLGD